MLILSASGKPVDSKTSTGHSRTAGGTWARRERNQNYGESQENSVYFPSRWRVGLDDRGWLFPCHHLYQGSNQMYFNFFCGVPDILLSGLCTNCVDSFHCRLCDHALWCLKNYQYVCYLFAVGLDGLCYLCLPMLQSLPLLVPFACTFGYFDGAYVTLIPVVTAEIVGTISLSSALGVVYFLHAVPYLVSPPIAGWLVDTTGSYTASFLLCGLSMIFSSMLLGFARLIKKMKKTQLRLFAKEPDPKLQLWTNGSVTYSVARELDQKDGESATIAVPGYNPT